MNYTQIINYLNKLEMFGTTFGLSRIKVILKKLGNPEKNLKVIHVAGTNGKGSVCAMIASILQNSGYKVGLYTSPHLKNIRERFKVNNKNISKKDFIKYFLKVKKYSKKETYFEFITAMAFLYFKDRKPDFLILEVGMGGRLDATNVIKPLVSVITSIGLDHIMYLGNTVEKIAYEKAGIIKNKTSVVTSAKGRALNVIKKVAKSKNSRVIIPKKYNFKTNLKGDFQVFNANIAVETINVLNQLKIINIKARGNQRFPVSRKSKISMKPIIKKSLKKIKWHGRVEFKGNVLFDCAHNPSGVKVLIDYIRTLKYKNLILVFGVLDDKDYRAMLRQLAPLIHNIILTKPKIYRALDPIILAEELKKINKYFIVIGDVKKSLKHAKSIAEKKDLILVTGSIYVVGEVI